MHRAANHTSLATALALALLAAGCNKARPVPAGAEAAGCTGCHGGTDNTTGAPPLDLAANASPALITVGAHSAHLAAAVRCEECHRVPTRIGDPGHIVARDGRPDPDPHAEVDFTQGRGSLHGATPAWLPTADRSTATCASVYCHGATLGAGGAATTPTWNAGPLPGPACSACHASPPPSHGSIAFTTCVSCHPKTVAADGTLLPGGAHLNGDVDVDFAGACTSCHGDAARLESVALNKAAPPTDLGGRSDSEAVGAHQAHLHDGPLARAFACAECHVVPSDMAHAAGGQQKVTFATAAGTIARNDGAAPGWTSATLTCSGVYCHGATIGGGSSPSPAWNGGPAAVGIGGATVTARCGVCHGFPPPAPHPQQGAAGAFTSSTECASCHPGTVDAISGAILVSQGLHVNGQVDGGGHATGFGDPAVHGPVALADLNACRACHGATLDGALGPSCTACHTTAGHPTWKTECTFCHGNPNRASFGGFAQIGQPPYAQDQAAPPSGTQGESTSSQVAVGAHLAHLDPAGLSRSIGCQECHGATLPSDETHADATVALGWGPVASAGGVTPAPAGFDAAWEASPTCTTYCHGASLTGGTRTNPSWTGTGQATCGSCHALPPGSWHPANSSCGQCHPTSGGASYDPAVHVNGQVELIAALSCTSCHGTAGVNAAPPRTTDGSTSGVKVGAHQPHLAPTRLISAGIIGCDACHPAVSDLHHASGTVDLAWSALASAGGTPSPATGPVPAGWEAAPTCTNYCHGATLPGGSASKAANWTAGTPAAACGTCHFIANPPAPHPALDTVGTAITSATQCGQCHQETVQPDGSINLVLGKHVNGQVDGGGHATGYSDPSTHGPDALASITSCQTCHGVNYDGNGTASKNCNACHADPAGHGLTGYAGSTHWKDDCTFCHGSALRAADTAFPLVGGAPQVRENLAGPPVGPNRVTTGVKVGAHEAHFDAASNGISSPILCSQCHGDAAPTDLGHVDGTVLVSWGSVATGGGTVVPTPAAITPGWEATPTCTNYCHGATLGAGAFVGSNRTPSWTATLTGCGTCHASPAAGAHRITPHLTACGQCHYGTMSNLSSSTTITDKTLHVNGTRDVLPNPALSMTFTKSGASWSCSGGCHTPS